LDSKSYIKQLIADYNNVVKKVDTSASIQTDRAYGGLIRSSKGKMHEDLTEHLVLLAWQELGGERERISIDKRKIPFQIRQDYIDRIANEHIRNTIEEEKEKYAYKIGVDKHVYIDGNFVMGIECKAYTENAMIKRILVDFDMLKSVYPRLKCYLVQLESQLGGDYSTLAKEPVGSYSTRAIESHFPNVHLNIITLLKGERKVDQPIHKPEFYKELTEEALVNAVEKLKEGLREFL
jgi:hypothetical protein